MIHISKTPAYGASITWFQDWIAFQQIFAKNPSLFDTFCAFWYVSIYPLINVYITMENHHFQWENSLFLWPFSIAFCMFTRGYIHILISSFDCCNACISQFVSKDTPYSCCLSTWLQGGFQRRQFFPPFLHFRLESLCPSCNLKGPKARFYTGHQLAKVQRWSTQLQFSWEFQLLKFQDAQIPIVHSKLLLKCQNSIKKNHWLSPFIT